MAKEVKALQDMECFEFCKHENRTGKEYQKITLHMNFDCKQDGRRKAQLVAGGHQINLLNHDVYSSTVKCINICLLHAIAHSANMELLCGDIDNTYVNVYTTEKVYAVANPEFGSGLQGKLVILCKALYGLATSCTRFHDHLADTLRSMNFVPTRFDCNDAVSVMDQIQKVYTVKSIGPPEYYLDNNFKKDSKGRWLMGCKKYITKALTHVQTLFGVLSKHDTPMVPGNYPEMDDSPTLND
eukprot:8837181-Ditylum_brightwellii.AAC.1